jgi:hypothetical protein
MYLQVTIWTLKKDVLIGVTTCLTGCDPVSYDFLRYLGKWSMKRHEIYAYKPTNMKATLRVVENISLVVPLT